MISNIFLNSGVKWIQDHMLNELKKLNLEIMKCQACSGLSTELKKTSVINRGLAAKIMIVGRNPGNKELSSETPFSGPSGKKLDEWLTSCGNTSNPRDNIYLTSVIKCFCNDEKSIYKKMAQNCLSIFQKQIELVQPEVIISLGEDSYEQVKFVPEKYNKAIFNHYVSTEHVLFNRLNYNFTHIVWPHPSPLNRQLNDPELNKKMQNSFDFIASILRTS